MTQYEMMEQLAGKCDVTLEEARMALETAGWNPLTATHLLEQEEFRRMQELREVVSGEEAVAVQVAPIEEAEAEAPADQQAVRVERTEANKTPRAEKHCRRHGFKNLGGHIRRLLAWGNRNRFTVHKGDERILDVPVIALALMTLCAFWVCVPLLIVGLFLGCRYSFSGRELGRKDINDALDKASDAANRVKRSVAQA